MQINLKLKFLNFRKLMCFQLMAGQNGIIQIYGVLKFTESMATTMYTSQQGNALVSLLINGLELRAVVDKLLPAGTLGISVSA